MRSEAEADFTPAEAYALWGERIHCLFSVGSSAFTSAAVGGGAVKGTDYMYERRFDAVLPDADGGGLFPACFYARMLRAHDTHSSSSRDQSQPKDERAAAASVVDHGVSVCDVFSSVSQQHAADEAEVARRMAVRLRHQTFKKQQREQKRAQQHTMASSEDCYYGHTFMDPKIEAQQAQLNEELTEILLAVRRKNKLSEELRQNLVRTKMLLLQQRDADTA